MILDPATAFDHAMRAQARYVGLPGQAAPDGAG